MERCQDEYCIKKMKGTEVLTLGTVGVINLYTQVHVHTTKLFWPAICHHGLATSVG